VGCFSARPSCFWADVWSNGFLKRFFNLDPGTRALFPANKGGWMAWEETHHRVETERRRRERQRARLLDKAQTVVSDSMGKINLEAGQELEKIRAYELALYESPISRGGLVYTPPNQWSFREFSDPRGEVKFTVQLSFSGDDVTFDPEQIDFERRTFRLLSVCITRYGTFLGFEITYDKDVPGEKTTRLINCNHPEYSLVAIRLGDQLFLPIEGDIDGQVLPGTKRYGTVVIEAFEGNEGNHGMFEVVFIPKDQDDASPLKTIRVTGGTFPGILEKVFNEKSLYEKFREKLDEKTKEFSNRISAELSNIQQLAASQPAPESGCMIVLAFVSSVFLACCLFFIPLCGPSS